MPKRPSRIERLIEKTRRDHIWQRQAPLRDHLKLKPKSWEGVNLEYREWWEEHLRFLKLKEDFAANGPGDTSGGVLYWLEAQAAEKAAIDAALAGVTNKLRDSPGRPNKQKRNAEMLAEFDRRRPASNKSDSALAADIGKEFGLKRRASIEAIGRAKKVRGKRV
jgi:hypothetical protein